MTEVDLRTAIGRRLKALREEHGLSLRTLAAAAETSPLAISRIESGKVSTNVDLLARIAKQLGSTASEVLRDTGAMERRLLAESTPPPSSVRTIEHSLPQDPPLSAQDRELLQLFHALKDDVRREDLIDRLRMQTGMTDKAKSGRTAG